MNRRRREVFLLANNCARILSMTHNVRKTHFHDLKTLVNDNFLGLFFLFGFYRKDVNSFEKLPRVDFNFISLERICINLLSGQIRQRQSKILCLGQFNMDFIGGGVGIGLEENSSDFVGVDIFIRKLIDSRAVLPDFGNTVFSSGNIARGFICKVNRRHIDFWAAVPSNLLHIGFCV